MTVVSRGGAEPWYDGLCDRYVDVFDALTTEEFREATLELWEATGGLQKQVVVRAVGRAGPRRRARGELARAGARSTRMLMYRLFRNVWQGALPLRDFLDRACHRPWPAGGRGAAGALPEEFTAVRFYFRESFPDTPENRALVHEVVDRLAARRPVVLLNTGVVVDDHHDAEPAAGGRILRPLAGTHARAATLRRRAPSSPAPGSSSARTAVSPTSGRSTACPRSASPPTRLRSTRCT